MDIEASVVERLQKLRQWQLEQQERLLKQQQIQRDMLTQKQDCMYKALELSIQELDLNEDTLNINNSNEIDNNKINNKDLITLHNKSQIKESCIQMINDNISCISQNNSFENMILQQKSPTRNFNNNFDDIINIENHIKRQSKDEINSIISSEKEKQIENFFIDGIAPLPPDKTVINHISIDDIPIFSPKKDFHTLLEEKLKDNNEIEPLIKSNASSGNKIKKPFLRKGEGLTRFKLNQKSQSSTLKIRSRSASFNNKTQSGFKYSKNENKSNKSTQDSKNAQLSKNIHCTNLAQKHLSLKNIPLPKKKIHSKSESNISSSHLKDYINEMKNTIELNSSDFHSGTHKELEEVRIFELLEEKAENSSFCSTSSTVTAFLQQSTPFKVKNAEYKTENNMKKTKQIIPINKVSKKQLDLKSSNQIFKCTTSNKDITDDITHSDFMPFENQKTNHDSIYENIQHIDENNTMKTNEDERILRNEIQSTYNEQNFCNVPVVEKNNEINDSLHVRFSEHNEYKTIGLTDTSNTSTESLATKCFLDDKLWSDSSILETESIIETIPIAFNMSQPSITMKSKMQELNYKTQNCEDIKQDNNSICETNIHQYVYHKDELEISDTEDQISNDEASNSYKNSQNNSISQKTDNYNIRTLKQYMKRYDNKEIDEYVHNCDNGKVTEYQENVKDLQETNGTIFKSELLRNRLLELEQEISIFRKENTALSMQRKKLHEDYKNLCKEYAEKEKNFEQNKKQMEERLQEEKKKLARQKAALENRMRDSQEKAQQSKLERQENQNLKQEIIKLTEEMQIKESRWNAAESRYKCQMRILKRENSKLKQETERLQNLKKNDRNKGKFGTSANTKVIHQINKQLDMQLKESQKINDALSQSDQKLMIKTVTNDQNIEKGKGYNCNHNKNIINKSESQTTITDVAKKRNLYENLIKEATSDLIEIQEQFNISENLNKSESELSHKFKKLGNKTSKKSYDECDIFFNHNNEIKINEDNQIKNIQLHMQNDHTSLIPSIKTYNEKSLASSDKSNTYITTTSSNKTKQDAKQDVTQIEYFDGSIEYRFPNGNIKKIFPDQGVTKLIYYNGDMRETNKDGKIKYFYASTCTWHTTMPDGLEILEFSE